MVEFSENVGHCLHRSASGVSERAWVCDARQKNFSNVHHALGSARGYCDAVRDNLVKNLPTKERFWQWNSPYCQYANCGEGGRVGACLAFDFGFTDTEIRLCQSENDHFFAMVLAENKQDWCLLDRWANIGNFRCGVNWNAQERSIDVDGITTDESWFEKVTCISLKEFA